MWLRSSLSCPFMLSPSLSSPLPPLFLTEGTEEPVKVREVGEGVYECDYYPVVPGKYVVSITWGGYAIPRR